MIHEPIPRFISYAPNVSKALEAVLWIVEQKPGIDVYLVCKCLYFADLKHLSRYGRSIFGEKYVADTYGPRGEAAYGLMRHRMDEMIALGSSDVPVRVMTSAPWTVTADRGPDREGLSESDIEVLAEALTGDARRLETFERFRHWRLPVFGNLAMAAGMSWHRLLERGSDHAKVLISRR